jgi:cyclopropane fatty-acyl-phospholipid synthase-like methyltransferase
MKFTELDEKIRNLYDDKMGHSMKVHDLIFSLVFPREEYIGQYSDNGATELLQMAEKAGIKKNSQVLDIGSGPGGPACFLASRLGCKVTGLDISTSHLAYARTRAERMSLNDMVDFIEGSVWEADLPQNHYDAIIGTGAWCHLEPTHLFPRVFQWLKPGGFIAFMERIKLSDLTKDEIHLLCDEWACPSIESVSDYCNLLYSHSFSNLYVEDMTEKYKDVLQRCIEARLKMKNHIISITDEEFFRVNLNLASYEEDAARSGKLDYAMFVGMKHKN